ncbi:hypothetical protein ACFVFS_06800 [Kitasatospora sp. NPDC057692]|uniref:hypothetical protein n=1 Tax=Kitasatospora sp. NPDC057692 TaxID=3346215 RepID=UPI003678F1B3
MDEGGEPACWLDRVCDECGKLRERSGPGPCEHCGSGARAERAEAPGHGVVEDGGGPRADHRR